MACEMIFRVFPPFVFRLIAAVNVNELYTWSLTSSESIELNFFVELKFRIKEILRDGVYSNTNCDWNLFYRPGTVPLIFLIMSLLINASLSLPSILSSHFLETKDASE